MLVILISGAPGCGKGTQSSLMVEKYNLKHLSTGELLRSEVSKNTELGNTIDRYISKGNLVPDDLIIDLLAETIDATEKDNIKGFVIDGFPRTLNQAEALEKMMEDRGMQTSMLIDVKVEENELIDRLVKRGKVSGRSDDNLQTIKDRLNVYHAKTEPINNYYQNLDKYKYVDGVGAVEEIFDRISEVIESR